MRPSDRTMNGLSRAALPHVRQVRRPSIFPRRRSVVADIDFALAILGVGGSKMTVISCTL